MRIGDCECQVGRVGIETSLVRRPLLRSHRQASQDQTVQIRHAAKHIDQVGKAVLEVSVAEMSAAFISPSIARTRELTFSGSSMSVVSFKERSVWTWP